MYKTGLFLILALAFLFSRPLPGQFGPGDMAGSLEEAQTYQKYPTYDQYLKLMQGFASDYPEICRLDTLGSSVEGRLLLALKISDHVELDEPEPAFLYSSTMHGDEILGYVLMLRLADSLVSAYGTNPWITELVDTLAIWINPLANPDGSYAGGNHSLAGAIRENADGQDLNRTFPNILEGEGDETEGRPLENRHMMEFLREGGFHLSANLHSGAEVVNYPWDWKKEFHPDDAWFRFVSLEYADEARSLDPTYMAEFEDGITNGYEWYEVQGSRQDYVTYFLGGREVTLELSHDFFMEADHLQEYWELNRLSLLYYMNQAAYGIHGKISSALDRSPLRARIEVLGHDDPSSVVYSDSTHGDFYRFLKEGSYDLSITADGYQDQVLPGIPVKDYSTGWLTILLEPLFKSSPETLSLSSFGLFPNPAGDYIFAEIRALAEKTLHIKIISPDGRICKEQTLAPGSSPVKISLEGIRPGIYLLQITNGEQGHSKVFMKY